MKKKLLLMAIVAMSYSYGQNGKVGINTNEPQRILDVNGDLKVRELNDVSNLSTYPSYDRILVADNGTTASNKGNVDYITLDELYKRLGVYPAVSEFKTATASSTSTADAITLTTGCLKIQADPYIPFLSPPNVGYNVSVEPSCGTSSYATFFVVDGNASGGVGGDYWRGTLTNSLQTITQMQSTVENSSVKFGRLILHDFKQAYEVTWSTNGVGAVTHSLYLRRLY